MRKTQFIINEARQNTNTVDVESITDDLCVRLLNRSQEFIQALLFTQGIESKIFRSSYVQAISAGIDTYSLPFDIYAKNSVNNLMHINGNRYSKMDQISEKARGTSVGYFLSDSSFILSPMPQSPFNISVSYTRRLPAIGTSHGTVLSVVPNTSITLSGFSDMTVIDDYMSIVDANGVIIAKNITTKNTLGTFLVSDTTGITAGMFAVPGKYATTHCQLPDELESALVLSLEAQIMARISSKDILITKPLSDEMISQIGAMFADNTTDTFMPPLTEYTEWV